jgi:hypothetical protein
MCPDNGPKLDSFWAAEAKATGKRSMLALPRRDASEPAFHPIVVFVLLGESFGYGGRGGIRTLDTLITYTHFPGVRLKPLGHPS